MENTTSILTSIESFNDLDQQTKQKLFYNASLIASVNKNTTANQAVKKALKKEVFDSLEDLDFLNLCKIVKQVKQAKNDITYCS